MPCRCRQPRPQEGLSDLQNVYFDEELEENREQTLEKKIAKYDAIVDAIRHGDYKLKGVKKCQL